MAATSRIFNAWQDEPWTLDGAAVRVSLVCSTIGDEPPKLNGASVKNINSDLTSEGVNFEGVLPLIANKGVSFVGLQKGGSFDVPGEQARAWIDQSGNPNGRPNSDVLRPAINGGSIVGRDPDRWLIDFGLDMSEAEAAMYELPYQHLFDNVRPLRLNVRRDQHRLKWWIHGDARPGLRASLEGLKRYVITPMVSKHRVFTFVDSRILPENKAIAFAKDDLAFFGVLQSRFHETWSLRLCSYIGVGNDPSYAPSRCFETFPFPDLSTEHRKCEAIASAAGRILKLRNAWLNPPEYTRAVPDPSGRYPDRLIPKDATARERLRDRTLTILYNKRPVWLSTAHAELDQAVAAAYGWPAGLPDNDTLARLLALNQERAALKK